MYCQTGLSESKRIRRYRKKGGIGVAGRRL